MATSSVVPSPAQALPQPFTSMPELTIDDPSLLEPAEGLSRAYDITERDPDTGDIRLSPWYESRLSPRSKDYALALAAVGLDRFAKQYADCYTLGAVHSACPSKDYSKAYRLRCHDPGCHTCGRGRCRLGTFLESRDLDALLAESQIGIELTIPIPSQPPEPLTPSELHSNSVYVVALATLLVKALGADSVLHIHIDPANHREAKVRIALARLPDSHRTYRYISIVLQELDSDAYCEIRRAAPGPESYALLEWVFSGLEPALLSDATTRAGVRKAFQHSRMIRVRGEYYRPLSDEALAARREAHAHKPGELCPRCHAQKLVHIPHNHRIPQPVEDIESEYQVVSWSAIAPSVFDTTWRMAGAGAKGRISDYSPAARASDASPPPS